VCVLQIHPAYEIIASILTENYLSVYEYKECMSKSFKKLPQNPSIFNQEKKIVIVTYIHKHTHTH